MTEMLDKAFAEATRLSPEEQNALAERILADLQSEKRWNTLLAASQDMMSEWAAEALAEHRAGKTIPVERSDRKKA